MECNRNYVLTFGKHRGKKLIDILHEYSSYLLWLDENVEGVTISDALYFKAERLTELEKRDKLLDYDFGDFHDIF